MRHLLFTFVLGCAAPPPAGSPDPLGQDGAPPSSVDAAVEPTIDGGARRTGPVRAEGRALVDDLGRFQALGATMMWGAWGYRHDRPRLEANLAYLAAHGYHFVRVLGVVGDPTRSDDYWEGREADPAWPDYDQVIAGLTDLAYDSYGLRIEWTIFGGTEAAPSEADQLAVVDRFLAMAASRPEKVILLEVANEYWQNGFEGDEGRERLRRLARHMNERTDVLVAASAPWDCEDGGALYADGVADVGTYHFERQNDLADGPWRPVRQPWEYGFCAGLPEVGSNNEPIGPGSSVATEDSPPRLAAAALVTYVAGLPFYVFHSRAGVRGDLDLFTMPGVDAFARLGALIPADLSAWERKNCHWPDSPFRCYARDGGAWVPDMMWPDLGDPTGGAVRVYSGVSAERFVSIPFGIREEILLEARRAMDLEVVDPMTGATLATRSLAPGEQFTVSGVEVAIIRGTFR